MMHEHGMRMQGDKLLFSTCIRFRVDLNHIRIEMSCYGTGLYLGQCVIVAFIMKFGYFCKFHL